MVALSDLEALAVDDHRVNSTSPDEFFDAVASHDEFFDAVASQSGSTLDESEACEMSLDKGLGDGKIIAEVAADLNAHLTRRRDDFWKVALQDDGENFLQWRSTSIFFQREAPMEFKNVLACARDSACAGSKAVWGCVRRCMCQVMASDLSQRHELVQETDMYSSCHGSEHQGPLCVVVGDVQTANEATRDLQLHLANNSDAALEVLEDFDEDLSPSDLGESVGLPAQGFVCNVGNKLKVSVFAQIIWRIATVPLLMQLLQAGASCIMKLPGFDCASSAKDAYNKIVRMGFTFSALSTALETILNQASRKLQSMKSKGNGIISGVLFNSVLRLVSTQLKVIKDIIALTDESARGKAAGRWVGVWWQALSSLGALSWKLVTEWTNPWFLGCTVFGGFFEGSMPRAFSQPKFWVNLVSSLHTEACDSEFPHASTKDLMIGMGKKLLKAINFPLAMFVAGKFLCPGVKPKFDAMALLRDEDWSKLTKVFVNDAWTVAAVQTRTQRIGNFLMEALDSSFQ